MTTTNSYGVCFQYAKTWTCPFGLRCKFSHDVSMTGVGPEVCCGRSLLYYHTFFDRRNNSANRITCKISQRSKLPQKYPRGNLQRRSRSIDHINHFFEKHPNFDYDPTAPIWMEFNRMCDEFGWNSDDYEMRKARRNFKSAMVQQFNDLYGTDEEDLTAWQKLCHILNIDPVPEGLKKCREVRIWFFPLI